MPISTRLTDFLQIESPVLLAPMDPAAGGELAAAVSNAGGLGLLGGGYGDRGWLESEFPKAGGARIGCGFITWSLAGDESLLEYVLERRPAALMLSFSDPARFAPRVIAADVPLICQIHDEEQAQRAIDVGASILVAQGTEAGGHSRSNRGTLTLVPAIVDLVAKRNAEVIVVGAGGVADGRGLAALLALGADGALLGTRFWATREALIHPAAKARVVAAGGDETLRTTVYDIARGKAWPEGYTGRLMRNEFIDCWHGRESELSKIAALERATVESAYESGDYDIANVTVGEAIGLIDDIPPAGELLKRIVADAESILSLGTRRFGASHEIAQPIKVGQA